MCLLGCRFATQPNARPSITFSTIDIAGQEKTHAILHPFCRRRAVYLVVFDMAKVLPTSDTPDSCVKQETVQENSAEYRHNGSVRSDDTSGAFAEAPHSGDNCADAYVRRHALSTVDYWLKSIAAHAAGAPVFIIGTNKDAVSTPSQHGKVSDALCPIVTAHVRGTGTSLNIQTYTPEPSSTSELPLWFFPVNNTFSICGPSSGPVSAPSSVSKSSSSTHGDPVVSTLRDIILKCVVNDKLDDGPNDGGINFMDVDVPLTTTVLCDAIYTGLNSNRLKPQISWFEFVELAWQNGVPEAHIEDAASLLHDLGVLTCFRHVKELRGTVVLGREWIIDALMAVILLRVRPEIHDAKSELLAQTHMEDFRLAQDHGILHRPLLMYLWENYPTEQRDFLLALLQHFSLVISISTAKDLFLVPSLLPTTEQKPAPEWARGRCADISDQALELRCRVGKTDTLLPIGAFERLVAQLVSRMQDKELRGLHLREHIQRFELTRTSGKFLLGGFEFFLRADHLDNHIKVCVRWPRGRSLVAAQLDELCSQVDKESFGGNLGFGAVLWGARLHDMRDRWRESDTEPIEVLFPGVTLEALGTWFESPDDANGFGANRDLTARYCLSCSVAVSMCCRTWCNGQRHDPCARMVAARLFPRTLGSADDVPQLMLSENMPAITTSLGLTIRAIVQSTMHRSAVGPRTVDVVVSYATASREGKDDSGNGPGMVQAMVGSCSPCPCVGCFVCGYGVSLLLTPVRSDDAMW